MSYEMEMPTPCQKCGEIFDLNDGTGSDKWYPQTVICESCGREEEKQIEQDEEMRDFLETVENADYEIQNCIKQFRGIGTKFMSDEYKEYYDKAKEILSKYAPTIPPQEPKDKKETNY